MKHKTKHKIITPADLPDYEEMGELYTDMNDFLGKTPMLGTHIMQSELPSCLVFYVAGDSVQSVAVSVSSHKDEMLSLEELVERQNDDDFYVVYKNRVPSATFSPRGAPIGDPSKCYRFKKVPVYRDFSI